MFNVLDQHVTDDYSLYLGDSCEVLQNFPDESFDLSVYSPPFQSLFTYTPTARDLGNSKTKDDFFGHYRFIIKELFRLTKAGRVTAVHVADLAASLNNDGYIGLKDFSGSVFWLIDSDKPTDIFLNPTGESGIYTMLNRWIRHCSDLPIRLFQIGNTFRSHHRPYPLINSDESTPLLEGHGVFGTRKEATDEFDNVIKILENMHNTLVIPYRIVMRPQWGNNPVSEKNVSFESYFPPKGVNLNVGVAYFQDQLFSRIFEIVFKGEEEKREYTHQLTFGINERALAAMLSIHADDKGLRFIPGSFKSLPISHGLL